MGAERAVRRRRHGVDPGLPRRGRAAGSSERERGEARLAQAHALERAPGGSLREPGPRRRAGGPPDGAARPDHCHTLENTRAPGRVFSDGGLRDLARELAHLCAAPDDRDGHRPVEARPPGAGWRPDGVRPLRSGHGDVGVAAGERGRGDARGDVRGGPPERDRRVLPPAPVQGAQGRPGPQPIRAFPRDLRRQAQRSRHRRACDRSPVRGTQSLHDENVRRTGRERGRARVRGLLGIPR